MSPCVCCAARQSKEEDWQKFAIFDPAKYTRNLVDDGNGKFNLMVLCWGEGQMRCAASTTPKIN